MTVPEAWTFLVLAAAAWRTWALASSDSVLDGPRDRLFPEGSYRRDEFLDCPYCAGFWIAGAWTLLWFAVAGDGVAGLAATWAALSAAVVIIEGAVDRL